MAKRVASPIAVRSGPCSGAGGWSPQWTVVDPRHGIRSGNLRVCTHPQAGTRSPPLPALRDLLASILATNHFEPPLAPGRPLHCPSVQAQTLRQRVETNNGPNSVRPAVAGLRRAEEVQSQSMHHFGEQVSPAHWPQMMWSIQSEARHQWPNGTEPRFQILATDAPPRECHGIQT